LFEKKSRIPNPWNTLRRSKHQSSDLAPKQEALKQNSQKYNNKNEIRLKNLQKHELYQSSPSLLGPDLHFKTVNKRRSEGDKYFPSLLETGADVLQFTSKMISKLGLVIISFLSDWDTYGSLITLNFRDDDRVFKPKRRDTFSFDVTASNRKFSYEKESHSFHNGFQESSTIIPTNDCESDMYEEINENEDSGTFCDSDSGISSLYETIIKYQSSLPGTSSNRNSFVLPETIKENDQELDNENLSLENHLEKENVVNCTVHGVSTGGSLFNLTGMQITIKIKFITSISLFRIV
jgi:hypothetical protein